MRRRLTALAALGWLASIGAAFAQSYPSRPIELVVPFPPGGALDVSARFLGEKWSEQLGQPIVVVNRPGAGAALGARHVATARPDGYTLLIASESPLITARLTQPQAGYDLDSFSYVFAHGTGALFFVLKEDAPWRNLRDFVEAARARPGAMSYGSYGSGTLGHFAAELFLQRAHIDVLHVPYRSSPEANTALYAGQVDLSVSSSTAGLGQGRGVRLVATTAEDRLAFAPDLPTLREQGYEPGLNYYALVAGPRGLPDEVVSRLAAAHRAVSARYAGEIATRLAALELIPVQMEGPAIEAVMRRTEAQFRDVLPRINLQR